MKRPDTKVMLLGHPLIAMPMMLAGGVTLVAAMHASNLLVSFFAMAMLATVGKAYNEVGAYRTWAGAWNGMAPAAPRARRRIPGWLIIAALALAWFGLLCLGGETARQAVRGTALTAACIGVVAVLWIGIRSLTRRRRSQRATNFSVAVVARPALAVPILKQAYRDLPSYCHALLGTRP